VVRPGFYPLPAPQVSTALLASGGSTGLADLRAVRISRRLPSGQMIETEVDLFTPLAEGDAIPDLRLEDGDVMFIPRLDLAELDEYDRFLVSRSTLAQESITIRALNYTAGGGLNTNFGTVQLPNGSRLLDAVTATGVSPDRANFRQIALVRFDPEEGRAVTMRFDMFAALEGDLSQNPPLQNNDVLIANRNLLTRITYALNTFTQPFRDILGFLLFFDTLTDSADDLFNP
ncbi:MAG: polysaccharide export protein, partial [Cyanobacteria bacterium P01_H01_bin.119]